MALLWLVADWEPSCLALPPTLPGEMEAALRALAATLVDGAAAMASEILGRLGAHFSILWYAAAALPSPSCPSLHSRSLFPTPKALHGHASLQEGS